jgi:ABC-type sugar transport system ATPase subunit
MERVVGNFVIEYDGGVSRHLVMRRRAMPHSGPKSLTRPLVGMRQIGKCFGPVRVLEDVDFDIYAGEVHVLAGENGAGKSTLIKILGGVHAGFEGTIELEGRKRRPGSPQGAAALGVAVIHQEL